MESEDNMGIKNAIRAVLKRWLDNDMREAGGVTVHSGSAGVLTVESGPDRRQATLAGMQGTVGEAVLELKEAGVAWLEIKFGGRVVQSATGAAADQHKEFDRWAKRFKAMSNGAKGSNWAFKWAVLICAVLMAMIWFGLRAQNSAVAAPAAPVAAQGSAQTMQGLLAQVEAQSTPPRSTGTPLSMPTGLPDPGDDDKIFPINKLSEAQIKEVQSTAHLIKMGSSGKPFYVFSNPTCGACQHLESEMDKLKEGDLPVIVPVAFDVEGFRRGTAVMCAPNPAEAWKQVMKTGRIDSPLCIEGLKKMEKNAKLFEALGFQATPTVIAADGRGSIGSVSSGVLAAWLGGK